jgi:PAS domain S-box-containing protein
VSPINIASIVNSSADLAFATDTEGRIVAWNRGAEELFGYAQPRAVGQTCWALLGGATLSAIATAARSVP